MKRILPVFLIFVAVSGLLSCASVPVPADTEGLAKEYYNLATAYAELKKLDKAREYFSRALELDPSLSSAGFNFARALIEQEKYAEAEPLLRNLRLKEPRNIMVAESLAYCLARSGRLEEAEALYRVVLGETGERLSVVLNLARLVRSRDPAGAWDLMVRARALAAENKTVLGEMADLALDLGRDAEAVTLFDAWKKAGGDKPEALEKMAFLNEKLGFYARAMEIWRVLQGQKAQELKYPFALVRLQYTVAREYEAGAVLLVEILEKGYADWPEIKRLYEGIDAELQPEFLGIVRKYLAGFPEIPAAAAGGAVAAPADKK